MTLLIIRHGETPLNVARVIQPADTPLSPNGQAQALLLAQRLAGGQPLRPAGIVSSDLPRALQTAQALAAATGLAITTSALLHERNFGDLRGLLYDSLGFDPLTREEGPPNGESIPQFAARCAAAWAWVLQQQAALGGPLAVVTHGLVIRQWLHNGPLQVPPQLTLPDRLSNTSLTVASAAMPFAASLVDCTVHLGGAVVADAKSLSGG
ncbi:MAG: phosphoglycerate mutase family protein [Aquabacterium sp.]|nr:phosphoglycerate mutase family protein [Aquabacterium sp.]